MLLALTEKFPYSLFFLSTEYVFSTDEAMTGAAPICVDETGKVLIKRTPI